MSLSFTSMAITPKQLVTGNHEVTPDDGDPDGPLEGGLDDPTDWSYFAFGCLLIGVVGIDSFTAFCLLDYIEDEWDLVTWLFLTGVSLNMDFLLAWMCFAEAFDMKEIDNDGC